MRLELTHGSGAKTFINSHGQLIHITLDGQYHLMAEGMAVSLKQLEELVIVISRQGGQWDHPTVTAKVQELRSPEPSPATAPMLTPVPEVTAAEATPEAPPQSSSPEESDPLRQQLA